MSRMQKNWKPTSRSPTQIRTIWKLTSRITTKNNVYSAPVIVKSLVCFRSAYFKLSTSPPSIQPVHLSSYTCPRSKFAFERRCTAPSLIFASLAIRVHLFGKYFLCSMRSVTGANLSHSSRYLL